METIALSMILRSIIGELGPGLAFAAIIAFPLYLIICETIFRGN